MDKKGFTLIELMISISLLSIVLIFMMNTLVKLRDTSLASGEETNLLVGQAIISKTINNDIILNGGVSSYECTDNFIELTLMNNETRYIELNEETNNLEANTVITYRNPSLSEAILVRKLDDKYSFDKFVCEQINEDISRIRINFKENESIISYSEIFITKFEELKTIGEKILADNTAQSDAGISFGSTSESDGTVGLYYTSDTTKTENGEVVYYYRGAVTNNYLVFGDYCWRIVRTVEDGSGRLRYGGEATQNGETYTSPQTGTTVSIGEEEIHESAGAGFYYTEYKESLIKTGVENWYRDNIAPNTSLANLVEDTPYCSDGTYEQVLAFETDFGSTYDDYYGAYNRLSNNNSTPQYKCEEASYGYTVAKGDLTYPIGLLTADEVAYAGAQINGIDSNYLSIGADYWTMSVAQYLHSIETVYWFNVNSNAGLSLSNALNTIHLVPAISLKRSAKVERGTGLYNDPYVIKTN